MVPRADIIPPRSGIAEFENMLPPLDAMPTAPSACPLEFVYQIGK